MEVLVNTKEKKINKKWKRQENIEHEERKLDVPTPNRQRKCVIAFKQTLCYSESKQ